MEDDISGAHAAAATEHKVRQFLKSRKPGSASLVTALTKFNQWANTMELESEMPLATLTAKLSADDACDQIEKQAAVFIEGAEKIERQLLSKSLQEALIYCAGFNMDLSPAELRRKFRQTLRREGSASISRRFLAYYLFNFVWFHTGESFRSQAWTSAEFESDLQNAEKFCERIVVDSWNSAEIRPGGLDLVTTRRIVRKIEERLRGGA